MTVIPLRSPVRSPQWSKGLLRTFAPVVAIYPTCACCRGRGYLIPKPDPAILIAAMADAFGERPFTVAELQRHAKLDDALRFAIAGMSAIQIGKLLYGRVEFEYCGKEHGSGLWKLRGKLLTPPFPL